MANFLKNDKKQIILTLLKLGHSQREIQKITGIRRETISRYGKLEGILDDSSSKPARVPAGSSHVSQSLAAPYREKIEAALAKGLNATRIYQDLKEEGFPGKCWSIRRFVQKLKNQKPEFHCRIETPPGKEAQVDLGKGAPTYDPVSGKYKIPYLFKMTLSFSRNSYDEVIWKQDTESFIRAHENAFREFGGVTAVVILDNLKAGVSKACFYDPVINPVYQSFAKHYGFEALPCKIKKPQHKGKVESGIGYTQDNALKGKSFKSLDEQNLYLKKWNKKIASLRIHGTTKEQVIKRFTEKEQKSLLPLPDEPFKMFKIFKRRVHVDGHIEVDAAYYSVPCQYLAEEVTVHCDAKIIRVYSREGKEIAVHLRQHKGRFRTLEDHLPEEKRWSQRSAENRLKKQAEHLGKEVSEWAQEVFNERGVLAFRVMQGVISLTRKYSAQQINQACKTALSHQSFRYQSIKLLCERQQPEEKKPLLKQEDEIIRPLVEYASFEF